MYAPFRSLVTILSVLSLASTGLIPLGAANAAAAVDYQTCQVDDEVAFRAGVAKITATALEQGLANVDYGILVDDGWRRNGLDKIIDTEVDVAIEAVKADTSWGTLISSLLSKETAQQIATTAAERVYQSEAVKIAIEAVAADAGKELANRLELATLDAAIPAVGCVRAYLGPRFGDAISGMMGDQTAREFQASTSSGGATVTDADVAINAKGAIAGVAVLLVRRTLANLAKRLGQRVVGAVLGKIVSVVAGGIGIVLLARDLWDFRNGVLPIIAEEMKADGTKANVRVELAAAIKEQLGSHVTELSTTTADRILSVWQEFKTAHAKVVELSAKLPDFKTFLDAIGREHLPRVDALTAIVLEKEGEAGVVKRLADGTLDNAVKNLPDAAFTIATDTRSLDDALAWQSLAGDALPLVVKQELHRHAKPADFSKASLDRVLAITDINVVNALVAMPKAERDMLTSLPADRLEALTHALAPADLDALGRYLRGLSAPAAEKFLTAIADLPARMKSFTSGMVEQAVIGSRDQEAAIAIVLRDPVLIDVANFRADAEHALSGQISPLLIWERQTGMVVAAAALLLLALLMLNRVLFAGRRRPAAAL